MSIQQYIRTVREFSYAIRAFVPPPRLMLAWCVRQLKMVGPMRRSPSGCLDWPQATLRQQKCSQPKCAVALSIVWFKFMAVEDIWQNMTQSVFFRDARTYRIYEGTTQILQLQIVKHMLREWAAQS